MRRPEAEIVAEPDLKGVPVIEGCRVLPPCALWARIGAGGMGAVYHGRHLNLDIEVAVKCLKPELASRGAIYVSRFLREARLAAAIQHENLVRVYDVSEKHGIHYLVMEYVAGETARERVERKGALSEEEAATIILGAARGLSAAHDRTIVHRDVKPDNILISHEGVVKLADLGIAKAIDSDDGVTMTQGVIGTPQYMPPEQWDDSSKVEPTADVWSLGATLFYLVTGRHAIRRASLQQMLRDVTSRPFPECPGISDELAKILARCTEQDPKLRYPNARELVLDLEDLVGRETQGLLKFDGSTTTMAAGLVSPPPAETLQTIKLKLGTTDTGKPEVRARRAWLAAGGVLASIGIVLWIQLRPVEAGGLSVADESEVGESHEPKSVVLGIPDSGHDAGTPGQEDAGITQTGSEETDLAEQETGDVAGEDDLGAIGPDVAVPEIGDDPEESPPSRSEEGEAPRSEVPASALVALDVEWGRLGASMATRADRLRVSGSVTPPVPASLRIGFEGKERSIRCDADGTFAHDLELPVADGSYELFVRAEGGLVKRRPIRIDRNGPALLTELEVPELAIEDGRHEFVLEFDEPCTVMELDGEGAVRTDESNRKVVQPEFGLTAGAEPELVAWTYTAVDGLGNESRFVLQGLVFSREARALAALGQGFPPSVSLEAGVFTVRTGLRRAEPWRVPSGVESIEPGELPNTYRVSTTNDSCEMVLVVPWVGPRWQRPEGAPAVPFLLDRHEVTWSRFGSFTEDPNAPASLTFHDERRGGAESHAVRGVELEGALAFAEWAGKKLPTVQEFLFAAVHDAGGVHQFTWGDELEDVYLNVPVFEPLEVRKLGSDRSPWGAVGMGVGLHEWCLEAGSGHLMGSTSYWSFARGRSLQDEFSRDHATWEERLNPRRPDSPRDPRLIGFRCVLRLEHDR